MSVAERLETAWALIAPVAGELVGSIVRRRLAPGATARWSRSLRQAAEVLDADT